MADTKPLSAVGRGERFKYAGYELIKIADSEGGAALCLFADNVGNRTFDDSESDDWRGSTIRKWLNEDFFAQLMERGAAAGDLSDIESDLTADDGMRDYGTATDKIALISCRLYRKHREFIPVFGEFWWTLTAWTCIANRSYNARRVVADGMLIYGFPYRGSSAVRPLLNLSDGAAVAVAG